MSNWRAQSAHATISGHSYDADLVDGMLNATPESASPTRGHGSTPPEVGRKSRPLPVLLLWPKRLLGAPSIEDIAPRALRDADLQAIIGSAHTNAD